MELFIWDGESKWGVPSMDIKSLQMLTYAKFSGAPISIHKSSNPFLNNLPSFKCSDGVLTEFSDVCAYLRKKNYGCEYEMSPKQCSEIVAYEQLLLTKLHPALMYLWWVEPKSYYDVIHKWFFKSIPFPYKFWYPGKFHSENTSLVSSLFEEADSDDVIETELHKQAQECLTLLEHRFGENEYFFGIKPTVIDAIIFSYLVLLLKVDLKICVLQNHIKACPNLSKFVGKILQRYFPAVAHRESMERNQNKEKTSNNKQDVSVEDIPNKGRNMIISGLTAAGAMFGYALWSGLVQVDIKDNFGETEDYDFEQYGDYDEDSNED